MVPRVRFSNYVNETVSIESLYDFIPTNSFSRDNLNYETGSVKNIHYGDILTDFQTYFDVNRERVPYVNKSLDLNKYSDFNFCKPGDIIFADASEDYDGIGKHIEIISISGSKILAGLHTIHARLISDKVEIGFMAYQLQSWNMRYQIMRIAQGTKVFGISTKRLGKIFANIPPKSEQQKIASFLSSVDEKISQLEKKKTLLETYKRGIMQKIFSQELRFKDENGREFPEWEEKKLSQEVKDFIVPMRDKPKNLDGEIPWCRIEDFDGIYLTKSKSNQGVTQETIDEMNLKVYPINTVLVSCSANLGFCSIVKTPLVSNQTFIGLVSGENLYPLFLYYLMRLSSRRLNTLSSGTTISYLSRKEFENFKVMLPDHIEQQKIASFLSIIDKKIEITSTQLEKTRKFKKGLLQQMFI